MEFSSKYINVEKNKKSQVPNLLKLSLDQLIDQRDVSVVERKRPDNKLIIRCKKCDAILTRVSKLNRFKSECYWNCEYCSHENQVNGELGENQIPDCDENVLLKASDIRNEPSPGYFIFCIDASNSMGKAVKIPQEEVCKKKVSFSPFEFFESSKNFISNSEAVKMAIYDSLNQLEKNAPQKRVGIVTFNKNITIIGDGQMKKIEIDGEKLLHRKAIKLIADKTPPFEMIETNKSTLIEELDKIKRQKYTALGSALYYSVLIASRTKGSQVLLCTDGKSNRGLGVLTDGKASQTDVKQFYDEIIEIAVENGVSISIVTLEGSSCGLKLLKDIACKTGGYVRIVKPLKLRDEFYSLCEKKILAVNARAVAILPREMYFKDYLDLAHQSSKLEINIGNILKDTEITYNFELRPEEVIYPIDEKKTIQVQVQFYYESLEGEKHMRVIVKEMELTENEILFETNIRRDIVGSYLTTTQISLLDNQRNLKEIEPVISTFKRIRPISKDNFSEETFNAVQTEILDVEKRLSNTIRSKHSGESNSITTANSSRFPESHSCISSGIEDDIIVSQMLKIKDTKSKDLLKST